MPKSNKNYSDYFTFDNVCAFSYCLVYFVAKLAEALEKEQNPASAYTYFDTPEADTELEGGT